jgi:putative endonuclease
MWFVYLLECNDKKKSYYCGITNNLEKRIVAHNNKTGSKYTRGRTPVKLLKSIQVATKSIALKIEYQVKQLPRDKKLTGLKECQ